MWFSHISPKEIDNFLLLLLKTSKCLVLILPKILNAIDINNISEIYYKSVHSNQYPNFMQHKSFHTILKISSSLSLIYTENNVVLFMVK